MNNGAMFSHANGLASTQTSTNIFNDDAGFFAFQPSTSNNYTHRQ